MDDGTALLRTIRDNLEEDMPRLAYADWLTENGKNDRGELIRLQIELAPYPNFSDTPQPGHMTPASRWEKAWNRTRELFTAHPDWSRIECPTCEGTGGRTGVTDCPQCWGSGYLLHLHRPHAWSRGFISTITARSDEVWRDCGECSECNGTGIHANNNQFDCFYCRGTGTVIVPTPWSRAVASALPGLEGIRIGNLGFMDRGRNEFTLRRNGGVLPQQVEDAIYGHDTSTPEAAHAALGRAVLGWLRSQ